MWLRWWGEQHLAPEPTPHIKLIPTCLTFMCNNYWYFAPIVILLTATICKLQVVVKQGAQKPCQTGNNGEAGGSEFRVQTTQMLQMQVYCNAIASTGMTTSLPVQNFASSYMQIVHQWLIWYTLIAFFMCFDCPHEKYTTFNLRMKCFGEIIKVRDRTTQDHLLVAAVLFNSSQIYR